MLHCHGWLIVNPSFLPSGLPLSAVSVHRQQHPTRRPAAASWKWKLALSPEARRHTHIYKGRVQVQGGSAVHEPQPIAMAPTPATAAGVGEELSTEVVVIRHGETAWNASRIVQGQMDPELNEAGRQQAVVVARRLSREVKPAAVYSSDLKRASETAEIIAKACGVSNVVLNEALRERHMGYLQGLKWEDAVAKNPDPFRGFDIFKLTEGSDPDSRNKKLPGGGESMNQLNERCVSYLNKIAQEHIGERVVVVSHGGVTLELCQHTDPPNSSIRRHIPNTSLNVFRISGITGQWTLERCGDVSHLKENGFLEDSFGGDGASA